MNIGEVRRYALSLPQVTEAPHFHLSSFRVNGKIFATVPSGGDALHVFVDETLRAMMIALNPDAYEALWWGKRVVGLRVKLPAAQAKHVRELLRAAWTSKAPKRLAGAGTKRVG